MYLEIDQKERNACIRAKELQYVRSLVAGRDPTIPKEVFLRVISPVLQDLDIQLPTLEELRDTQLMPNMHAQVFRSEAFTSLKRLVSGKIKPPAVNNKVSSP